MPSCLQPEKYFSIDDSTDNVCHVKEPKKIAISEKATEAIEGLKPQTDLTDLVSFLSLCTVFHQIVSNFTRIASR